MLALNLKCIIISLAYYSYEKHKKWGKLMNLDNLYNFKNPIRHFVDIKSLEISEDISTFEIKNVSWTKPFKFRVRKQEDKFRTLKIPNILNFIVAYEKFKDNTHFENIQEINPNHQRISANIETGDFVSGEYDKHLQKDFERLCIYDYLLKVDIKEYYGRIYTHNLDFQDQDERYLTNMNLGATNGLIMGNYLSLYFAELNSKHISDDLEQEIEESNIECRFSYFSDDYYFFCNKRDIEKIINIFDKILEKYELERNEVKKEIWSYETFNNHNIVARYWKKVMSYCNKEYNEDKNDNKLYFINQIIYRISQLKDDKHKKVFINNFFKTRYFRELDLEKFKVKDYDYHQLCFLFKFSPEVLLYSIDKFASMTRFNKEKVHEFFKVRYNEILRNQFNDEQLYFYYAIKILDFTDILRESKNRVLESNNQILISYYLKDELFDEDDIDILTQKDDESFWFQNYHLILYSDKLYGDLNININKYLIPAKSNKELQRESYMNFYKNNLELKNPIIREITNVDREIVNYLILKIAESEEAFESALEDNLKM